MDDTCPECGDIYDDCECYCPQCGDYIGLDPPYCMCGKRKQKKGQLLIYGGEV